MQDAQQVTLTLSEAGPVERENQSDEEGQGVEAAAALESPTANDQASVQVTQAPTSTVNTNTSASGHDATQSQLASDVPVSRLVALASGPAMGPDSRHASSVAPEANNGAATGDEGHKEGRVEQERVDGGENQVEPNGDQCATNREEGVDDDEAIVYPLSTDDSPLGIFTTSCGWPLGTHRH